MNPPITKPQKQIRRWMMMVLIISFVIILGTLAVGFYSKSLLLRQNPALGRLVDVGGYKMHLYCSGSGSPTIILEAGIDDFSFFWSLVQPSVSEFTQVCSYDRAGLGWSESSPNPRSSENMVKDLHALLINANVEPPRIVLSRGYWDPIPGHTPDQNEKAWQTWQELQSALPKLSNDSNQIIASYSEHFIHLQQPDIVTNAIHTMLQKVRGFESTGN